MKKFCAVLIIVLTLCLSGCFHRTHTEIENWRVVSEITVTCENEGQVTRRIYTSQDKMKRIMHALRDLGQKFTPDVDPETLNIRTYCITLTHTDGSQRIYCTKGDRYIRQCRDKWQEADPEKVSELNLLLQGLPGDVDINERRIDIPKHQKAAAVPQLFTIVFPNRPP